MRSCAPNRARYRSSANAVAARLTTTYATTATCSGERHGNDARNLIARAASMAARTYADAWLNRALGTVNGTSTVRSKRIGSAAIFRQSRPSATRRNLERGNPSSGTSADAERDASRALGNGPALNVRSARAATWPRGCPDRSRGREGAEHGRRPSCRPRRELARAEDAFPRSRVSAAHLLSWPALRAGDRSAGTPRRPPRGSDRRRASARGPARPPRPRSGRRRARDRSEPLLRARVGCADPPEPIAGRSGQPDHASQGRSPPAAPRAYPDSPRSRGRTGRPERHARTSSVRAHV